jgi:hypothetical protein
VMKERNGAERMGMMYIDDLEWGGGEESLV